MDLDLENKGPKQAHRLYLLRQQPSDNSVVSICVYMPVVEVILIGGTGGCMLGGSEEDLCRPPRSIEPGFHPEDPEDWTIPPRPAN